MNMKSILRTFFAVAAVSLLVASCDVENKKIIYTPDGADEAVTFLSSVSVDTEIDAKATTFDITVARSKSDAGATVKISNTMPEGITVPESVSFAAGESKTTLSIDISKMEVGKRYKGTISLAEETAYDKKISTSSVSCTFAKAYTWISLGQGEWYDELALQPSEEDLGIIKVEVLKADGFDRWRIMEPYPKANVIAAWGEDSYVGGASPYIEFYTLDEKAGTIKFDSKIYNGLNYNKMGKIVYQYPSSYYAGYTKEDSYNKFIGEYVQFYVPYLIEGTTSWFGFFALYLGMPGAGDLATWLNEE